MLSELQRQRLVPLWDAHAKRRQHYLYTCRPRASRRRRTDARGQMRPLTRRLSARARDLREQKMWRRRYEPRHVRPIVLSLASVAEAAWGSIVWR